MRNKVILVPFPFDDLTELLPPGARRLRHSLARRARTGRVGKRLLPVGVQFLEKIVNEGVGHRYTSDSLYRKV